MRKPPIEERIPLGGVASEYPPNPAQFDEICDRLLTLKRQRAMLWRMLRAQRAQTRSAEKLLEAARYRALVKRATADAAGNAAQWQSLAIQQAFLITRLRSWRRFLPWGAG